MSCSGNNCSNPTDYNPNKVTFQTQGGRFGLCMTVFDPENGRFKTANETEKKLCCLNSCKSSTHACLETCKSSYNSSKKEFIDCRNNCARNIILCENMCSLSTPGLWRGDSPLIKCLEDGGYGNYPNYDIEKIKEDKDSLIKCCHSSCIPTSEIACVNHCKSKYADFVGESKDPLLNLYNEYSAVSAPSISSVDDNSWVYYLITLGVVILIVGVVWLLIRFRQMNT